VGCGGIDVDVDEWRGLFGSVVKDFEDGMIAALGSLVDDGGELFAKSVFSLSPFRVPAPMFTYLCAESEWSLPTVKYTEGTTIAAVTIRRRTTHNVLFFHHPPVDSSAGDLASWLLASWTLEKHDK
jgi:hypothetical protein